MKEITKEKVVTEVVGYKAFDGKTFDTKWECEEYEKDFATEKLMELVVGETSYELYSGCEDAVDYIVSIKDDEDLKKAMIVNKVFGFGTPIFKDSDIGKEIIVESWDDWSYVRKGTLDEILERMKAICETAKENYEKEKRK